MLVADGEPAAECFGCATSREQASIVYKQMKELVQASPHLSQLLEVVESRKTIACIPTNSFWRVISSDAGRQEGLNIHSLCYDEIHQAKDRKLWSAVRYGGIARAQSLILAITTAGTDRASVCYELHEHALKCMVDPAYDDQFFAFVAGATIEDDYRDPEVWRAANPSFGITMDEESFKADVRDAEGSKARLADFLRYRLNVWVQGSNKFVDLTRWERCKRGYPTPATNREWYCGLDLAQTWDVNAFVAVSKAIDEENGDEVFDVICRFWIPEDNAAQRRDEVPYVLWARDPRSGLTLTPGDTHPERHPGVRPQASSREDRRRPLQRAPPPAATSGRGPQRARLLSDFQFAQPPHETPGHVDRPGAAADCGQSDPEQPRLELRSADELRGLHQNPEARPHESSESRRDGGLDDGGRARE
jgi:phage terminase large subunit-like protein